MRNALAAAAVLLVGAEHEAAGYTFGDPPTGLPFGVVAPASVPTCHVAITSPIFASPTGYARFSGTSGAIEFGINALAGGFVNSLSLYNTSAMSSPLQIVHALNDSVEAGMQSTLIINSQQQDVNQAGGSNGADGLQWGAPGSFILGTEGIYNQGTVPLYQDTSSAGGHFSPCDGTSPHVADGQFNWKPTAISTAYGAVMRVQSQQWISTVSDQSYSALVYDMAMYLLNTGIVNGSGVFYLVTPDGVKNGPIGLGDTAAFAAAAGEAVASAFNTTSGSVTTWQIGTNQLAYVVLVYTVAGTQIGIAIHKDDGSTFNSVITTSVRSPCSLIQDICNGSAYHTKVLGPTSWTAGAPYEFVLDYDVGTPQQLGALGFPIQ